MANQMCRKKENLKCRKKERESCAEEKRIRYNMWAATIPR